MSLYRGRQTVNLPGLKMANMTVYYLSQGTTEPSPSSPPVSLTGGADPANDRRDVLGEVAPHTSQERPGGPTRKENPDANPTDQPAD